VVEVVVDNFHGALAAVQHLIGLGYRRIAFINGIPELQASQDRRRGYQVALQEKGIDLRPEWVVEGEFTDAGGYRAMKRLLATDPPPEAVFAASDAMALGAIRAIREQGLRVPQDVAIVGFDDVPLAAQVDPPLTTVRQPISEMGRMACRLLVQLIQGEPVLQRKVVLHTQLVVRQSCGGGDVEGWNRR